MIILIIHIVVSHDQNISLIFYVNDGSHVRLRHPSCVYISAQRQYTAAVLKMCTLLKWLSLPYILEKSKLILLYKKNLVVWLALLEDRSHFKSKCYTEFNLVCSDSRDETINVVLNDTLFPIYHLILKTTFWVTNKSISRVKFWQYPALSWQHKAT